MPKEYGAGLSVLASVPEEEQAFLIALLRTQAERSLPSGRHFEIRVMAPHDYGRGRQIGWYSPARSNTIFDWNAKPFLCERFKDAKFEPYNRLLHRGARRRPVNQVRPATDIAGLPAEISVKLAPHQAELWALPRQEAEALYLKAVQMGDEQALRWLARHDRYFVLTYLLRRGDARHDWLYARCREVEADPDDRIDLWSREHYKLQRLDEPTPTPLGYKLHGDLVPGDQVFGPDGVPCRVIALAPVVTDADCYEIEFDDGFKIQAGAEHLWRVEKRSARRVPGTFAENGVGKRKYRESTLLTTRDIFAHDHQADSRLSIPVAAPIDLPAVDLPIDPYTLGAWLGDGFSGAGSITCQDFEVWRRISEAYDLGKNKTPRRTAECRAVIGLHKLLRISGLLGDKRIPEVYLRASTEQRLALLQGLMDTDGHCNTRGTATFVNTNEALVDGFAELCQTLGLKPRCRQHVGSYKGEPYPYWQVSFQGYRGMPPFGIERKLARCKDGERPNPRRYIVACRKVPSVPMRCIQVDREDGMYLTGKNFIPTHNSTIITFAGIIQEVIKNPEVTVGIFSHNRPGAKAFMKQIKMEFEDNKLLKGLFPDIFYANPKKESPKWNEDDGIIVKRKSNPKESTIEAWGLVDGMPTGKHFALMVYDDVVTEESVTNSDMIKKVTERWELSENLGTRGGRIWTIGTRYHFADTYAVMIKRGVLRERRHPATHDGTFDGKPVFLTEKQWERKKASTSKSTLAAQQLLNPLAGSETKFAIEWLKWWRIRPRFLNVYILCDPSKGRMADSDRTAIVVIGIDATRNKYLLDGFCHRMKLSKRWTVIRDLWRRWSNMKGVQSAFCGYEQFGMQTDLEYFEERMEIEGISIPIDELSWPREGKKSKEFRIERLEPDIRMGRFKFPEYLNIDGEGNITQVDITKKKEVQEVVAAGEPWRVAKPIRKIDEDERVYDLMTHLIEEYTFFPLAPHDDVLDALSRIYDMDPVPPVAYGEDHPHNDLTPEIFPDT